MEKRRYRFYFGLLLLPLITACDDTETETKLDYRLPEISAKSLQKAGSAQQLEQYLKNGLILATTPSLMAEYDLPLSILSATSITTDTALQNTAQELTTTTALSAPSAVYSTTNTQEADVDEIDRIEYNGANLFILKRRVEETLTTGELAGKSAATVNKSSPLLVAPTIYAYAVRIMQRDQPASMSEVVTHELDAGSEYKGLYLAGNKLAALGHSRYNYGSDDFAGDRLYWGRPRTILSINDVTDVANVQSTHQIEIDGYNATSRVIGSQIILVNRYTPDVPGLIRYALDEEQQQHNQQLIDQLSLAELLPKITINNAQSELVNPAECYLSADAEAGTGYPSLTVVTMIDLNQPEAFKSACLNTRHHGYYASSKSLYLTATRGYDDETVIHKIDLAANQPAYRATGSIEGHLGWGAHASHRMSEQGEYLRVVATQRDEQFSNPVHQLNILHDKGEQKLEQVSQLPNDSHPEPIGKPGETIQAVRFYGDRAYVVTFLQIDPFYVIDLADPLDPVILGELELPGFSSYLKAVNENLVLGFGQQNWSDYKLSLFDVSDPSAPVELNSFTWPEHYSELRFDPHALAFVETAENQFRFSFPLTHSNYNLVDGVYTYERTTKLVLFDLDADVSAVNLSQPVELVMNDIGDSGYGYNGYTNRSVIHADEVHYVYDHRVWSASWDLSLSNHAQ